MTTNLAEPTTLYLVRHGQTVWNLEQRFQGHLDIPLDDLGQRQAEAVATALRARQVPFQAVYASDLIRAAHTAAIIGAPLGLRPIVTPALREIDCGIWAGRSVPEIERQFPGQLQAWNDGVESFTLPGGESIPLVQRRAAAYIRRVIDSGPGQTVAVVAHGMVLTTLLVDLLGWDLRETWHGSRRLMGNTGFSVVIWDPLNGTASLPVYNSLAHLAGFPPSEDGWSRGWITGAVEAV